MKHDNYINSSPRFFRLIGWAAFCGVLVLGLLAALLPAPLQEQANQALVPNPVKAGWFLLWIQETVSWSKYWIYPVLAAGAWLVALPWLRRASAPDRACWWPRERLITNLMFTLLVVLVLGLTGLALFFRGENWAFVWPW